MDQGLLPMGNGQAPGIAIGRGATGAGTAVRTADCGEGWGFGTGRLGAADFFLAVFFFADSFLAVGVFLPAVFAGAFLAAGFFTAFFAFGGALRPAVFRPGLRREADVFRALAAAFFFLGTFRVDEPAFDAFFFADFFFAAFFAFAITRLLQTYPRRSRIGSDTVKLPAPGTTKI